MHRIDEFVSKELYRKTDVTHFNPSHSLGFNRHPYLRHIWNDLFKDDFKMTFDHAPGYYCTFFVCKIEAFWAYKKYLKEKIPFVLSHPYAFADAKYFAGKLTPEKLLLLAGVPHYPHVPFILERILMPFFISNKFTCSHYL
jgi:hypothetical protein